MIDFIIFIKTYYCISNIRNDKITLSVSSARCAA